MADTTENAKKVNEAIKELEQAVVPIAHQVLGAVQKSVAEINSALQLMDRNVDRIASAAVNLGVANTRLTASLADSAAAKPTQASSARSAKKR